MVSDWFEEDNFKRTVQQLLLDALNEMEVDFYRLDPVVQATLLDEAVQVGVQRSLEPLMRIKAALEGANADENHSPIKPREASGMIGCTPLRPRIVESAGKNCRDQTGFQASRLPRRQA